MPHRQRKKHFPGNEYAKLAQAAQQPRFKFVSQPTFHDSENSEKAIPMNPQPIYTDKNRYAGDPMRAIKQYLKKKKKRVTNETISQFTQEQKPTSLFSSIKSYLPYAGAALGALTGTGLSGAIGGYNLANLLLGNEMNYGLQSGAAIADSMGAGKYINKYTKPYRNEIKSNAIDYGLISDDKLSRAQDHLKQAEYHTKKANKAGMHLKTNWKPSISNLNLF